MITSGNSQRSVGAVRGLMVKVNLPIFKDEKMKDAVTYLSWWWDMAIFVSQVETINICCHMFSAHCKDSPVQLGSEFR